MLSLGNTASVIKDANVEATKSSASLIAGNIINNKVTELVTPKLPIMIRGYASEPIGKAVLANIVAAGIISAMPQNARAMQAANAMIEAANLTLMSSFNIEEMINDLLDNVTLPDINPEQA